MIDPVEGSKKDPRPLTDEQRRCRLIKDCDLGTCALDTSINAVGITDLKGRLVYVNGSLVRMWGYEDADELLGRQAQTLLAGDTLLQTLSTLQQSGSARGEDVGRRRDGSLFHIEFATSVITDLGSGATYLFGAFIDISERKRVEQELRQSERAYRTLVHNVPCMVYRGGADWRVKTMNTYIEDITGYGVDDFTSGRVNWLDLIHPDDKDRVLTQVNQSTQDKMDVEQEYRVIRKDGSVAWVKDRKSLFFDGGRPSGAEGVVMDITAEKLAQERSALAERLTSLGIMAAGLAHELNNPLSVLMGYVELLNEKIARLPPSVLAELAACRKGLTAIENAGRRCQGVVDGMLTFAEPSRADRRRNSLRAIVTTALELVSAQHPAPSIEVIQEHTDEVTVWGHFNQLQLVFTNIILNALQVMKGEGRLVLRTWKAEDGRGVSEITDSGPGIPAEQLPKIFDPFFTTKPPGTGMGMGLSIAYAIVKDHGGEISVQSTPGQKTTFTVTLPSRSATV